MKIKRGTRKQPCNERDDAKRGSRRRLNEERNED
jgi:hypothetical protein